MGRNPHQLFIAIASLSFLFTVLALLGEGRSQEILDMLMILLPVLACVAILLVLTRKYWMNVRSGGV